MLNLNLQPLLLVNTNVFNLNLKTYFITYSLIADSLIALFNLKNV